MSDGSRFERERGGGFGGDLEVAVGALLNEVLVNHVLGKFVAHTRTRKKWE